MTIQDFIRDDCPFFHITGVSKLPSILSDGLKAKRCNAICVVRSQDRNVLNEICRQVCNTGKDRLFAVIKLTPSKHGITADMISEDSVSEITAPLHNYIHKSVIPISEEDVIINNLTIEEIETCIDKDHIVSLSGYLRPKCPSFDADLEKMLEEYS